MWINVCGSFCVPCKFVLTIAFWKRLGQGFITVLTLGLGCCLSTMKKFLSPVVNFGVTWGTMAFILVELPAIFPVNVYFYRIYILDGGL